MDFVVLYIISCHKAFGTDLVQQYFSHPFLFILTQGVSSADWTLLVEKASEWFWALLSGPTCGVWSPLQLQGCEVDFNGH